MANTMDEDFDLENCSAEELMFRIQLANAECEQAEVVAQTEALNYQQKAVALENELRETTGMEPIEFEEFLTQLPEDVLKADAIKPLKGTVGERPKYDDTEKESEPIEYLDAISQDVKEAAVKLRDAKHKEEMLVEEVVELKKVRNRLFGDNEGTVSNVMNPTPGALSDPISELSIEEVLSLNGSRMAGVENLLTLKPICEATIAESLQSRYAAQQVYSCIDAESLVITNPNAWLSSSSKAMAAFYDGKPFLAPHVNSQAQALLQGIATDGRNRSLFLCGESGSGKSSSLKHLLDFFKVSMKTSKVITKLQHAQNVLSAFTRCMSEHTDDSSRVSTAVELQLDSNQHILGCSFSLAGLELSRLTECHPGQRSFHVLYYVANGTTPPEQEALHFQPEEAFTWLTQDGVTRIPGVDDESSYHELKQSLLTLEFTAKERAYLLRMISLILHLGNLEFCKTKSGLCVGPVNTLEACATMLRCDVPALSEALTQDSPDNLTAGRNRDGFARLLYSRVTDWVVRRLNQALSCDADVVNVLVVLDPAGFEGSSGGQGLGFDQLMRNYAHERLAHMGEQLVYARTEADFAREGISSPGLDQLEHASAVMDLFQNQSTGLITLVKNTTLAPIDLVSSLSKLSSSALYTTKSQPNSFTVRHTCGDVKYDATSFRRLSVCKASPAMIEMLKRSLCTFLKSQLFSRELPCFEDQPHQLPHFAQWKPPESTLAHTKFQLDAIARAVQPTEPRFTFCVRPNENAHPNELNLMVMVREIRSSGLGRYLEFLATALVWRVLFEDFSSKFHSLYPEGHNPDEHEAEANCEAILQAHVSDLRNVQFGKTRVYLARWEYTQLCAALHVVESEQAMVLQAVARAAFLRGAPNEPKLHKYNEDANAWVVDEEASAYENHFDKIKKCSTALAPSLKGWYARSIDRARAEAEAELARHANIQPAAAEAELDAATKAEWEPSDMQQQQMLAKNAVEAAHELLAKFDEAQKEGPLIMGTAFSDLADPETHLVTRESWNAHFGKDNFNVYDEDKSGVMDKVEWDKAFQSYASDFLKLRIEMFYEGSLKTVQKEIEDQTEEEQNMYYDAGLMAAEDHYLKLLQEAEMRKIDLAPDVENAMMAEEDRQGHQISALDKAEQAIRRLATLDDINQQADAAASSSQAPGFGTAVDPIALEQIIDSMVAQTKAEIDTGAAISPDKKIQQQRQMDNIHWQRVEERIIERENRKMIEMGMQLNSPEARSDVAQEIEEEARDSELVLQAEMNNLLAMFGAPTRFKEDEAKFDDDLVTVAGDGSPVHTRPPYKGKYGFKYKHNKLETMSINQ